MSYSKPYSKFQTHETVFILQNRENSFSIGNQIQKHPFIKEIKLHNEVGDIENDEVLMLRLLQEISKNSFLDISKSSKLQTDFIKFRIMKLKIWIIWYKFSNIRIFLIKEQTFILTYCIEAFHWWKPKNLWEHIIALCREQSSQSHLECYKTTTEVIWKLKFNTIQAIDLKLINYCRFSNKFPMIGRWQDQNFSKSVTPQLTYSTEAKFKLCSQNYQ